MRPMNNLDYAFLARELDASLKGAFLNQAYDLEGGLRLKFRGKADFQLLMEPGVRVHLASSFSPSPELTPFVRRIRETLENARVLSVLQLGFDRLLVIELEKTVPYRLVLEMFGKGNAAICDGNGTISAVLQRASYGKRVLASGRAYLVPPNAKKAPSGFTAKDFGGLTGKVVSSLSKAVNLAPFYLEEACARAEIPLERMVESLSAPERERLAGELGKLPSLPLEAVVYVEDGTAVEFAPFPLKKMEGRPFQSFASFSEALEFYYAHATKEAEKDGEQERLERTLASQEDALNAHDAQEAELRRKGDLLFLHYAEVQQVLEKARGKGEKRVSLKL